MRIIPKNTKISIELFKGIGLADIPIGLLFTGLTLIVLTSTLPGKLVIAASLITVGVLLLVRVGNEPNYRYFISVLRHLTGRKSFSKDAGGSKNIDNISAFKSIEDGFIVYNDYFGAAIEIPPVEFRFFSQYRRNISIDECLGNVLRNINRNYAANLVKLERRVPYDEYLNNEKKKIDDLRHCYECALISEEEFQAKSEIVFDRVAELERMNTKDYTVASYFYLVFFDSDRARLQQQLYSAINVLQRGDMSPKRLNSKELALFLKYSNELDFDEKELDGLSEDEYAAWARPQSLQVKSHQYRIDGLTAYTMAINNYPLLVGDAWLASVMSIPATKVVVKLKPMDKQKTIKNIDHSISELRGRYNHTAVDSTLIELNDHIRSLGELLSMLKSDNEVILNTDVYVTCYDVALTKKENRGETEVASHRANISNMRSIVRRAYREADLRLSDLPFDQINGYIGSQISGYDPFAKKYGRGIPGATAAAIYPWVFAHVQDPNGIKLGAEDGIPVFIDMFRRDSERVNSNVVIVGKSGSGKSYAAKSILVNLAADNSKIFVLDPENEYSELAENLHGKFINVGNAQQGRINPFHIITALEDDDSIGGITGSYASHMQFLEEFYRQILPDCEKEALEYLSTLTDRVYLNKGITDETNLGLLSPEDYPTFSDIYDEIMKSFQSTDNEYLRGILRSLMNYVSKFSSGGRNANIWNGPSTITSEENFTVFNFQSLLAGGNKTITNAQMMLVMKYIDNEIIKNREYNARYGTNRKIVVVIDEAHVFIDEKYPIALDFMYQLAKRIRKYNGMQIVITQNIKDFVGSEEISRKSSAIINACQYSYIFSLAPNDMSDLCKLYEKAGGINELEQDKIITAPRGNAFVVLGPTVRTSFQIEVPEDVARVFEQSHVGSQYFQGASGAAQWEDFLGASREKYLENRRVKELPAPKAETKKASSVTFIELTAEEYERELEAQAEKVTFTEIMPEELEAAAIEPLAAPSIPEKKSDNNEMAQMVHELRRMVDSMSSLGAIMSKLQDIRTAAVQQAGAAVSILPETEDFGDLPEIGKYSVSDELDDEVSEDEEEWQEDAEDESEEDDESDMSLVDYLRRMALREEATSDLVTDEEAGERVEGEVEGEVEIDMFKPSEKMDIFAFLEQTKEEVEKITVLDDMIANNVKVHRVELDELLKVIQSRK